MMRHHPILSFGHCQWHRLTPSRVVAIVGVDEAHIGSGVREDLAVER